MNSQSAGKLHRAVELDANLVDARIHKARILIAAKRLDVAQEDVDIALQQAPRNPDALVNRGMLRLQREDKKVRRKMPGQHSCSTGQCWCNRITGRDTGGAQRSLKQLLCSEKVSNSIPMIWHLNSCW